MSSLIRVSRERMVDGVVRQTNRPESKGFVAMALGLNIMEAMGFVKKNHDRNSPRAQEKNS